MAMLAADAARVLDDRGLAAAHVVGLSLGSAVALELAIRMPARVKSLVLVGGGAGGPTMTLPDAGTAARAVASIWGDTLRHRRPWFAAGLFSERFRAEHPELVAEYMPYFLRHLAPPWASAWQMLAVSAFSRRGSLQRVRAPTLVLHGDQDVMTPPGNAHRLARGIPGAELVMVPGGHAVPLERPAETSSVLLDWVQRHAQATPPTAARRHEARERVTRPLSLHAGALRNTRDALGLGVRALRRRAR
jgi:pimeloyl-ACP methyl ester carboxylesterase